MVEDPSRTTVDPKQKDLDELPDGDDDDLDTADALLEAADDDGDVPPAKADEPPEVAARPVREQLTAFPFQQSFRDGRSDSIARDLTDIANLPADSPKRQQYMRDLAEKFEKPQTYPEKIAAAKALLELSKGPGGALPETLTRRDVLIPEQKEYVNEQGGRPPKPGYWRVKTPEHHELQPLKALDVQRFLDNSAEALQKRTQELLKKPANDPERKQFVQRLAELFQLTGKDSPEKLACAQGLLQLCSREDGSLPDVLGTRDVHHPRQTRRESGGRAGTREVTVKEAWTEKIHTTGRQILDFLAGKSEGMLRRTAELLDRPQDDGQRKEHIDRAVHAFRQATSAEDRTAAAIALLELTRKGAGGHADLLASRQVTIPAKKEWVPPVSGRPAKPGYYKEIEPEKKQTDNITRDEVLGYLRLQAQTSRDGNGRLAAADALERHGQMTAAQHKDVVEAILKDDKTPEALREQLRSLTGQDRQQAALREAKDGRRIPDKRQEVFKLDMSAGGQQERLRRFFENVLPVLSPPPQAEAVKKMQEELKRGEFGPHAREIYNQSVRFLSDAATDMAQQLAARGLAFPPGCPIDVPSDVSGRKQSDELLREELKAGRLSMELKKLEPGQALSLEAISKMTDTGKWCTAASRRLQEARLRWQVKVFDDSIQLFNQDGKLDKWKSKDGMSVQELEQLQGARAEWLGTALQVRNYAHAIASFNKATSDKNNFFRLSISGAENGVFPDAALKDGIFPGQVHRDGAGRITKLELDLPADLDGSNKDNLARMERLQKWLEKYGPAVDQATNEISQASLKDGRMLLWGDLPGEGHEDGKPYNLTEFRVSSDTVKVKVPDGKGGTREEEMIRVVSHRQRQYSNWYSYQNMWGVDDVGKAVRSGECMVNGQPVKLNDEGVTVGKKGAIKVDAEGVADNHCQVRITPDGKFYLKDGGSGRGTYVNGRALTGEQWVEIDPQSDTVTLAPPGRNVAVDKDGKVKVDGAAEGDKEPQVKVGPDGRYYVKDNGAAAGTYLNGRKIGSEQWVEFNPATDKITLGADNKLRFDSDVRLYKPTDWVTILLDGKMQLMQAKDIGAWTTEAKAWHYGGKGAMVAMDVGMLVTGTIELKAAWTAAAKVAATQLGKEAAKVTAREIVPKLLVTEGFKRGAWHTLLGLTGFTHQAFENSGEAGRFFNKARGYAMMADITWGTIGSPVLNTGKSMFGLAKPAEEASSVAKYLQTASMPARLAHRLASAGLFATNFYYIPEIATRQLPGVIDNLQGDLPDQLLQKGVRQRGGPFTRQEEGDKDSAEGRIMRHQSDETRQRVEAAQEQARKKAELKDDDPARRAYAEELTGQYLDARKDEDRLVAALALLTFNQRQDGGFPAVLGSRYRTQDAVPDTVKLDDVKQFLKHMTPHTVSLFDKELKGRIDAAMKAAAPYLGKPADDPSCKEYIQRLIDAHASSQDAREKLATALAVVALSEKDGKLPDLLGSYKDGDGKERELKKSDLEQFLKTYSEHAARDKFDAYAAAVKVSDRENTFEKTRKMLELPADSAERKEHIKKLFEIYERASKKEDRVGAALALVMLKRNPASGGLPLTLAERTVTETHHKGTEYEMEVDVHRQLPTKDVMAFLKDSLPALDAGGRLAVADLLDRMGQAPLKGRNQVADLGGVLLTVLNDKEATPEQKKQALLNAQGLGLGDILEMHRYQNEPQIARLKLDDPNRLLARAHLSGRDSQAIEDALRATLADGREDKDVRALAGALLLATSEADTARRQAAMRQLHEHFARLKDKPGAFYEQFFKAQKENVTRNGSDLERENRFKAALILRESGQTERHGVTKQELAEAFAASITPNQPLMAHAALTPLLETFKDLPEDKKLQAMSNLSDVARLPHSKSLPGSRELRLEVLSRLGEIADKTDRQKFLNGFKNEFDDKVPGAREVLIKMLTPGTSEHRAADDLERAAAAKSLGEIGSNDNKTRALLKQLLGLDAGAGASSVPPREGAGGGKDPSPLVRDAAFDALLKMQPPGMRQICLELLSKETDAELLRKVRGAELGERRPDPDSAEYRERFRRSMRDLLANNNRSLAGAEDFIKDNYPLLHGPALRSREIGEHIDKYYNDFGGFLDWATSSQNTIDAHQKGVIERLGKEMNGQFDQLIEKAAKPEGDGERRALAWIVMSNAKCFHMKEKADAVEKAAYGLYHAARYGDAKTREAVAPLLTMCLTTQDRMPFHARNVLLNAITWLGPGQEGSPIGKGDAGIAVLGAVRRQFHMTPKDSSQPGYEASHKLQMDLLEVYDRYKSPEAIPILEAIAEDKWKWKLERDEQGRVKKVTYPDNSTRQLEYDAEGKAWKEIATTADGKTTVLVRDGKSSIWFDEKDTEKKSPWRGTVQFDRQTGNLLRADVYGREVIFTPGGATIEKQNGIVGKVSYADGSYREMTHEGKEQRRYIFSDASGNKQIWLREGNTDVWHRDTDRDKKKPWKGSGSFDDSGDYVRQAAGSKDREVFTTTGAYHKFSDGKPVYSTRGFDDASAHAMPLVRQRARQILTELRDGTRVLKDAAELDKNSNWQQLADNLSKVLADKGASSEAAVKAVFTAGLSRPLENADDPRRSILHKALNDRHERVQLAAAEVLFQSAVKEDRERAAEVLAGIAHNGGTEGFKKEALALVAAVRSNPGRSRDGDKALIDAAMETASPRETFIEAPPKPSPRMAGDRPIEYQEACEQAKAEMIAASQLPLDKFRGQTWWKDNGCDLLDERNVPEAVKKAVEDAYPGFIPWLFTSQATIDKKCDQAVEDVFVKRKEQLKRLTDMAKKESAEGQEAREALAYIVMSGGEPFNVAARDVAAKVAASHLADIYAAGGPGSAFVEQTMKAALVANPGLNRQARAMFVDALTERMLKAESGREQGGSLTRSQACVLLASALESEFLAMPKPGQPGFKESVELQKNIVAVLDVFGDRLSAPVLEAIATGHPDKEFARMTQYTLDRMRDSLDPLKFKVTTDSTTPLPERARLLKETLSSPGVDDEHACREIFRLGYSPLPATASDPRVSVLKDALKHQNERIRLAAAQTLSSLRPPDHEVLKTCAELCEFTTRTGMKGEAVLEHRRHLLTNHEAAVLGTADAILQKDGKSRDLRAVLKLDTRLPSYEGTTPDGRAIVVRKLASGQPVVEEFKDGKLTRFVPPEGMSYGQVKLADAQNEKHAHAARLSAAREALTKENYGTLTDSERDAAIKAIVDMAGNCAVDEKVRLDAAKFLGSERSLTGDSAKRAREAAFSAIIDLAAHGNATRQEARNILSADRSAANKAIEQLNRSLSAYEKAATRPAPEKIAAELALIKHLHRPADQTSEALLYKSTDRASTLLGADHASTKELGALIDRTRGQDSFAAITSKEDARIAAMHEALASKDETVRISAALALLDKRNRADVVDKQVQKKGREVLHGHLKGLLEKTKVAADVKPSGQAWAAIEFLFDQMGADPNSYAYTYATMRRMECQSGSSSALAPLYDRLARLAADGQDAEQAEYFRLKSKEVKAESAGEAERAAVQAFSQLGKRLNTARTLSNEAIKDGGAARLRESEQELLAIAAAYRQAGHDKNVRLADTMQQLATQYMSEGRIEDGLNAFKEAVGIYEHAGGQSVAPDTVQSLLGLNKFFSGQRGGGMDSKALEGKILAMSKLRGSRTVPLDSTQAFIDVADHLITGTSTRVMAQEAEQALGRQIDRQRQATATGGGQPIEVARTQIQMADFYMNPDNPQRNFNQAQQLLEEALASIAAHHGGSCNEEWAVTQAKAAHARSMQGDYKGALRAYGKAMDAMHGSGVPVDMARYNELRQAYGEMLQHIGRGQEVLQLMSDPKQFRQMEQMREQSEDPIMAANK